MKTGNNIDSFPIVLGQRGIRLRLEESGVATTAIAGEVEKCIYSIDGSNIQLCVGDGLKSGRITIVIKRDNKSAVFGFDYNRSEGFGQQFYEFLDQNPSVEKMLKGEIEVCQEFDWGDYK